MTADQTPRDERDSTSGEFDKLPRPDTREDADTAGHVIFPQAQLDIVPQGTPQPLAPLAAPPTSDLKRGKNNSME